MSDYVAEENFSSQSFPVLPSPAFSSSCFNKAIRFAKSCASSSASVRIFSIGRKHCCWILDGYPVAIEWLPMAESAWKIPWKIPWKSAKFSLFKVPWLLLDSNVRPSNA